MHNNYTLKTGKSCLFIAAMLLLSNLLSAQTTFGGFINNDYFNPGNWTGNALPSAANPGTIPGGAVVNIGSTLTINFTLTSYGTINANAQVTLTGTLNNYSGSDFNISSTGRLTNNGTMDQRGSIDIAAGGTFTSTANYSSTGSGVINNAGTVTISGSFSNLGTINNDGTLAITGGNIGNNTAINNNGTFNLSGGTLTNLNGANINNATGKTLTHAAGATLNNQGTLTNNGTYNNNGVLTSNGTIVNNGLFNNNIGGNITNNFRLNNSGTFNNNNQGSILNEFEINNSGTFNNNFFIDNGAQIYNLAGGTFVNAAAGDINNQFGSTLSNANIFNNIGEIQSVGDILNAATFTNGGSIYTSTGGAIVNSGNFSNNNLLNNLEEITNTGIFTNNAQLQNNSGGVFTNNGDLYNAQPARIANDYNIINNKNLYNNGTIENGVRVFNNSYFENNGYLINIGDFINDVTGIFLNSGTSTTTGSNGGVLENSGGGIFSNRGTLNNYNEIFNFACSSFINTGVINNYYWWSNYSLFFNYGTFNELPHGQMNNEGGVEITGPTSSAICESVTVGIGDNGSVTLTGTAIATSAFDDCATLTLTINDAATVSYSCADIGTKTVKLTIYDRVGTKVECSAIVTIVDETAPVFQNCPTDVVVVATGTTTPATWTAPTATDNCGPVNVTSTHTPGSSFPVGTTTVSYNAVDGRGNGAAPCEFKVIIVPPGECADIVSIHKVTNTATNCGASTAYVLWLNSNYYTAGSDLLFIQYTNGTAQLVGSVVRGNTKGYVEVHFSGKTTSAPSGSPKYSNCVNNGGGSWTYYTSTEGKITFDDCNVYSIKRFGPSFQVGNGANLQNTNQMGASGWFSKTSSTTQLGDFNFRFGSEVQCQNGIYLEAECATYGSKWQLRTDANASNGTALKPSTQNYCYDNPSTNAADLVTFNVNVTVAGSYRIFVRSNAPNGSSDSYWVRVNSGSWVKWNAVNSSAYGSFQWDQVGTWTCCDNDLPLSFNLVAGANTIQFGWREPNITFDKLYLTLSGKKPTGLGGNATNCGNNGGGDPFDGKTLCIKSRNSGKSADIFNSSTSNGTKLVQWDANGGSNQKFKFTAVGQNVYNITVEHSNKCLDATSNCWAGSKVVQNTCDGTNSQKWTIESAGSGFYFIKSVSSGLYLDVSGASLANGAEIILWNKHSGNNQQWSIESCGSAPAQCNKTVLFIVGDTWLCDSDAAIKSRLQGLGYTVTVKTDYTCSTSDANGKGLIVISSTVSSASVGTKYRDVNIPVVTWESYLFDDMKMTGSVNNNLCGTNTYVSKTRISDGNHTIAQGFTGDLNVFTSGKTINWGNPSTGATKIATVPGYSSRAMIFTYEAGASMVGMNAPARRAGYFLENNNAHCMTSNGWRLFDRTIEWASGCDLGVNAETQRADLLDLQAQRNDRMVSLYWQNNTGYKNQNFTLEKSTDGVNWEMLAVQDAYLNEDQSTNLFEDIDMTPAIGANHYRVTVTFLDGTSITSDVQVVTMNDVEDFGIYPNPASNATNLNLENLVGKKNVTIRIFDWTGRQVDQLQLDEVYDATYQLDLRNHQTGRYSVQISADGYRPVSQKLIISK